MSEAPHNGKVNADTGDKAAGDEVEAEISRVLERIDRAGGRTCHGGGAAGVPFDEDLLRIDRRINYLRGMNAPLLVLGGPLAPLAWVLNLPLRLLFRKQIKHNREVICVLTDLADALRARRPFRDRRATGQPPQASR